MTTQPRYIVFEGGDGSGKSTQAAILAERVGAILTREPGGTELGQELRRLLLNPGEAPMGERAEALLMAADRAQHLAELIEPALAQGQLVVSDRCAYSSLAYQGGGRELGVEAVRSVNDWAISGRWPDLVVFLDIEPAASKDRLAGSLDRLEQEEAGFHERARAVYLELSQSDAAGWLVIDAAGTIDEVSERVWSAVAPLVSS